MLVPQVLLAQVLNQQGRLLHDNLQQNWLVRRRLGRGSCGFFCFCFFFNKSDFLGLGAFSEVNLTCLGYWDLF